MTRRGRPPHPDILTPREWEVLDLLRQSLSNEQIAGRLGITERGAKYHVSEILSKLGVSSREEAAAWQPPVEKAFWRQAVALPLVAKTTGLTFAVASIVGLVVLALGVARTNTSDGDGAAADGDQQLAGNGNLFINPGFEDGDEPWFTINEDTGFTVTDELAHTGANSARLRMDDPVEASGVGGVHYLVQEVSPAELPEVVEGFYRVENWQRGTALQYLQFVVIAFAPDNFPDSASNFQLRYILAGLDSPPFNIANAQFVFVNGEEPVEGEWLPFSLNIRDDFQRLWNAVPEDFENLRLLFEVRWDDKQAGDGAPRADVYYDDLFLGERSTPPLIIDHWHATLDIWVCGEKQPVLPEWEAGLETHNDGIIHIHPFLPSEEGPGASLEKFFEYGGGLLTGDSIRLPGTDATYANGDTCPDGTTGAIRAFAQRELLDGHAQYVPQDGDGLRIIFGPEPGPYAEHGITIFGEATRTILIEVTDDGDPRKRTVFPVSEVEIITGETVRLVVANTGTVSHGLEIAGADGNFDTEDDNFITQPSTIGPDDDGAVIVRFDEPGSYAFRDTTFVEAGGVIIVTD